MKVIIYEGVRQSGCTTMAVNRYLELFNKGKTVILVTKNNSKTYFNSLGIKNIVNYCNLSLIDAMSLPYDYVIFDKCWIDKPNNDEVEYVYLDYSSVIKRMKNNDENINNYIKMCIINKI